MEQTNVLYRNLGGIGFDDVTGVAGVGNNGAGEGAAWCDYDGDGLIDLFATNATGFNVLYHNLGDGAFIDVTDSAGIK